MVIEVGRVWELFLIYGLGVTAVFTILALLYARAYRLREQLELTLEGALATRVRIYSNVGVALVGVLSMIVAVVCGALAPRLTGLAGYAYVTIGLVEWGIGNYHGRERRKLQVQTSGPSSA
jgi:hypothetical protein